MEASKGLSIAQKRSIMWDRTQASQIWQAKRMNQSTLMTSTLKRGEKDKKWKHPHRPLTHRTAMQTQWGELLQKEERIVLTRKN